MSDCCHRATIVASDEAGSRSTGMTTATPRVVTSEALLRGDAQLAILHEQQIYFLRRTRYGKLILTK